MEDLIANFQNSRLLPIAVFFYCFVSGLFPLVNAELFLMAIATKVTGHHQLITLGICAGLGQASSKIIYYYVAKNSLDIEFIKKKMEGNKIQKWRTKMTDWGGSLLLFSAFSGFPPFLVLSFIAGLLSMHLIKFLALGFIGRTIRFTLILYFPGWIKQLFL